MIYAEGFPMDDWHQVKVCPYCGNKKFSRRASNCAACGHSRRNLCIGKDGQRHANDSNARFCEICGEKTQFFEDGLIKVWDDSNEFSSNSLREELPF